MIHVNKILAVRLIHKGKLERFVLRMIGDFQNDDLEQVQLPQWSTMLRRLPMKIEMDIIDTVSITGEGGGNKSA